MSSVLSWPFFCMFTSPMNGRVHIWKSSHLRHVRPGLRTLVGQNMSQQATKKKRFEETDKLP